MSLSSYNSLNIVDRSTLYTTIPNSNIKGEMQRFWVFDCIALLDKDTYNNADKTNFRRQVCHRLSVNTGKFIVYCRSLTWLSLLGKPRL